MIIDADTHIAPTGGEFSIERHMARLDEAGIDASLVWLKPDYEGSAIEGHNRYVFEAAKAHPDRLIPFGWADPTVGVDHARAMARTCIEEYGFRGVKLNGAQNDYFIDDPKLAMPVVEEIARLGGMIAFHIGPDAYEKTHPLRALRIAERFPQTPVLLAHMGMADDAMNEACVRAAEAQSNIHLIGSGTTATLIHRAITRVGADRVLFGSDAPFKFPRVELAMYRTLLDTEFDERTSELVLGGNVARLFGWSKANRERRTP